MKNIKINGVQFRGQFGDNLEYLQKSNENFVTVNNFNNGAWEATSKVARFKFLLEKAGIEFKDEGESLRSCKISLI